MITKIVDIIDDYILDVIVTSLRALPMHNAGTGQKKGQGRVCDSWQTLNRVPRDLHVNLLPIMLTWITIIFHEKERGRVVRRGLLNTSG